MNVQFIDSKQNENLFVLQCVFNLIFIIFCFFSNFKTKKIKFKINTSVTVICSLDTFKIYYAENINYLPACFSYIYQFNIKVCKIEFDL